MPVVKWLWDSEKIGNFLIFRVTIFIHLSLLDNDPVEPPFTSCFLMKISNS